MYLFVLFQSWGLFTCFLCLRLTLFDIALFLVIQCQEQNATAVYSWASALLHSLIVMECCECAKRVSVNLSLDLQLTSSSSASFHPEINFAFLTHRPDTLSDGLVKCNARAEELLRWQDMRRNRFSSRTVSLFRAINKNVLTNSSWTTAGRSPLSADETGVANLRAWRRNFLAKCRFPTKYCWRAMAVLSPIAVHNRFYIQPEAIHGIHSFINTHICILSFSICYMWTS